MLYCQDRQSISNAQATLFITIAILAIAAIFFQLGKASFRLGQLIRKLVDRLDGTGGPASWIHFAYTRLRPERFLVQADSLVKVELTEEQEGGVGFVIPDNSAMRNAVAVLSENNLIHQPQQSLPSACSLAVRQAPVCGNCCLLKSKSGKSLKGTALNVKIAKLQHLKVLVS